MYRHYYSADIGVFRTTAFLLWPARFPWPVGFNIAALSLSFRRRTIGFLVSLRAIIRSGGKGHATEIASFESKSRGPRVSSDRFEIIFVARNRSEPLERERERKRKRCTDEHRGIRNSKTETFLGGSEDSFARVNSLERFPNRGTTRKIHDRARVKRFDNFVLLLSARSQSGVNSVHLLLNDVASNDRKGLHRSLWRKR